LITPRIYLAGRVAIEHGAHFVDERRLSGRQGRLAFTFLVAERQRPIGRDELISVVWPGAQPQEIEIALSAILSKLRAALKHAGWSSQEAGIDVRLGSIELRLPAQTWIDIEAAMSAVDEAEGALRCGHRAEAWSSANIAVSIARRPFLGDEDAPWIETQRRTLRALLARGLHCLSTVSAANSEPALAVQYAKELIALEPFRETAYQHLMRLHAQMGNGAEALRVFGACRELLREELGANPSPETEALFLEILRAAPAS
jgi:SARP family transcriptional regulator, regulator of embCAB operon